MITRREFLELSAAIGGAAGLAGCATRMSSGGSITLNDVHSALNATTVRAVHRPTSGAAVSVLVNEERRSGGVISISGGRHAMGGQQFAEGASHIDVNSLARVVELDRSAGEIEVEAGIQWPELYRYLIESQRGDPRPWTFIQKQTGADRLGIGGALSANVHGRQLSHGPFVQDVVAFTLVGPDGVARRCSRNENAELFRATIGGYGLFGVITSVRLRLGRRHKVRRTVEVIELANLPAMFERRIAEGFEFGDFQFATDTNTDALLHRGVFSCYQPVADDTPMPAERRELSTENWKELLYLAHVDRARGFDMYSSYYLTTSGQVYWSDEHQMSTYVDDYHAAIGDRLGAFRNGSEMITEIYVARSELVRFLGQVREDFRTHRTDLIYGTIRLIQRDTETLLRWAREPFACIIFNLHVATGPAGLAKAGDEFRRLIDRALPLGGSYYLTYHRWAERRQVLAAYPQFPEFLREKRRFDPGELFQSEWYRFYRAMFG